MALPTHVSLNDQGVEDYNILKHFRQVRESKNRANPVSGDFWWEYARDNRNRFLPTLGRARIGKNYD